MCTIGVVFWREPAVDLSTSDVRNSRDRTRIGLKNEPGYESIHEMRIDARELGSQALSRPKQ